MALIGKPPVRQIADVPPNQKGLVILGTEIMHRKRELSLFRDKFNDRL